MLAIRLRNVGRYFGPQAFSGKQDAREAMRLVLAVFGVRSAQPPLDSSRPTVTFAAGGHVLRDLDLDIEAGSVVCLAGASGSGKTVLLKLLARALPPTEGRIELFGPVSALIDVGDNLEPWRTGRENIDNHRRLLGIDRAAAEDYTRDVIAFAGIAGFEDIAVERYSTGMRMRLSMALAVEGNPPILVLDDVLGVGDISFQHSCVERLLALKAAGSTIVMASTDSAIVMRLASRVVTLSGGRIVSDGPPQVAPHVHGAVSDISWEVADLLPENDAIAVRSITVSSISNSKGTFLDLAIELDAKLAGQRCRPLIDLAVEKVQVFRSIYPSYHKVSKRELLRCKVQFPTHNLSARRYRVDFHVVSMVGTQVYSLKATGIVWLEVKREGPEARGQVQEPVIAMPFPWEVATASN
jgi:ABC-type polysaccharide/polyol phosphate transport system ATPase subunit